MPNTLEIYVGTTLPDADIEDVLASLDAGGDVEGRPRRLRIEGLETFHDIFSPKNLRLLRTVAGEEPRSIRHLARLVDRHPPEVTEDVHELAQVGLLDLVENGRALRPTMWYDRVELHGTFDFGDQPDREDVTAES